MGYKGKIKKWSLIPIVLLSLYGWNIKYYDSLEKRDAYKIGALKKEYPRCEDRESEKPLDEGDCTYYETRMEKFSQDQLYHSHKWYNPFYPWIDY
ncbi:hypothetical protein J4481_00910 [Candidatus Pacearchaeota archaeon]|nr:hypothetical protein [Candidatus Pacearchaeota archaeon]